MPQHDESLQRVAAETFEELAMMFLMDCDQGGPRSPRLAAVDFSGPFSGRLMLAVDQELTAPLAGNMLGLDDGEPIADDQQTDALKELLNVVCGNLLPELAGTEAIFHVHAPRVEPACNSLPERIEGMECSGRASMCLDAGNAELALFTAPAA